MFTFLIYYIHRLMEMFFYRPPKNMPTFDENFGAHQLKLDDFYLFGQVIYYEGKVVNEIPPDVPIVMFLHGNACDINTCSPNICDLSKLCKYAFVIPEYLGYFVPANQFSTLVDMPFVPNRDAPVTADLIKHLRLHYNYLLSKKQPVFIMGHSLGTGIAMELISSCGPSEFLKGLILVSPYLSIISVVSPWLAKTFPAFDLLKSYENVKNVKCNMMMIVGMKDEVIAPWHARKLYIIKGQGEHQIIEFESAYHNTVICRKNMPIISTELTDFITKNL
jgi:predicted alpha/beta hydrolase family esterase